MRHARTQKGTRRNGATTGPAPRLTAALTAALSGYFSGARAAVRSAALAAALVAAVVATASGHAGRRSLAAPRPSARPPTPVPLAIEVDHEGPVAVYGRDLAAAGWALAEVDPGKLAMSRQGRPIAICVERAHPDGSAPPPGGDPPATNQGADGRSTAPQSNASPDDSGDAPGLHPDDRILFYGLPMSGPYTRIAVYRLETSGPARRFGQRAGPPVPAPQARVFTETVRFEHDTSYDPALRTSDPLERWSWGESVPGGRMRTEHLRVENVAATADGAPSPSWELAVRVVGRTDDERVSPDHHVRLRVGDAIVAEAWFDGRDDAVIRAATRPWCDRVAAGPEGDGHRACDLAIGVENVGDTEATVDTISLDWVELAYGAGYLGAAGRLRFGAPGPGEWSYRLERLAVEGSGRDVSVLDVTDPEHPVRILGSEAESGGTGPPAIVFAEPSDLDSRYVAFRASAVRAPLRVRATATERIRHPEAGADYLVIAHPELAPAAAPLLALRRAQGMRVALVTVDAVYDAFSHGVLDPAAVRAFLDHARTNWPPPPPAYVVLLGDANLDYRDGYGTGRPVRVPSMQVPVATGPLGAVTSDQWFVPMRSGHGPPATVVGRLPAASPAEARAMVAKIVAYDLPGEDAPWRGRAILVADDDHPAFRATAEDLAAHLRRGLDVALLDAGEHPRDRSLADDIATAIDRGALLLAYVGHGNVDTWGPWPGGGRIFDIGRIARLENAPRLPLLVTATCMNGWFDHPLRPMSMAEAWLAQPSGGGIAAWSPSSYTTAAGQAALVGALAARLAEHGPEPIGVSVAHALAAAVERDPGLADEALGFVLFGDPATVLPMGARAHEPDNPVRGGTRIGLPVVLRNAAR